MQKQAIRNFVSAVAMIIATVSVSSTAFGQEHISVMNRASNRLIKFLVEKDSTLTICRNTASMGAGVCTGVVVFECFRAGEPTTFCCGVSPNALDIKLSDQCSEGHRLSSFPSYTSN